MLAWVVGWLWCCLGLMKVVFLIQKHGQPAVGRCACELCLLICTEQLWVVCMAEHVGFPCATQQGKVVWVWFSEGCRTSAKHRSVWSCFNFLATLASKGDAQRSGLRGCLFYFIFFCSMVICCNGKMQQHGVWVTPVQTWQPLWDLLSLSFPPCSFTSLISSVYSPS